jgi:hypothetical protein
VQPIRGEDTLPFSNRRPAAVLLLAAALAACDGASAPACEAPETRAMAAQRALTTIATRGGSREVPGNPDLLVTSGGDTVRFTTRGQEVLMTTGEDQVVATLAGIDTVAHERSDGSWSCSADLIAVNPLAPSRSLPRIPISYTSALDGEGRHDVFVQVRVDLMRPERR